ncbi:MAG: glycosyltransferase [Candidatus Margulisbacteria bacterium]|nr:glycosyltransferase [Candidatus Margulisiibacteriota bacterium]
MQISVVIGAYNQRSVLETTLKSFINQSLLVSEYEIIVVDSSSTDGTDRMIEELKPPYRLNYLRVENQGKSAARNFGIQQAKYPIILLTDADMEATPTLLEEHRKAHENQLFSAFEGMTINPDKTPYIKQKLKRLQKLAFSYFLTGNLSIGKKLLIQAGLFDEAFSGYGWEDIELGYRLHQMKIPLYYLPSAVNFHNHPVTAVDMLKRKYEMGKSAAYFYQKHPNFEIKMFLGMNPIAMGIYHLLKKLPRLLKIIKNQYILEEYNYRLGLIEGLNALTR